MTRHYLFQISKNAPYLKIIVLCLVVSQMTEFWYSRYYRLAHMTRTGGTTSMPQAQTTLPSENNNITIHAKMNHDIEKIV